MTSEPERTAVSLSAELVAEVAQAAQVVPGVNVLLNKLSPRLLARLKGTNLERFLARNEAARLVLDLRARTSQEIGSELLHYLAADLRENLKLHLDKAVRAVIFLDSFEAVATGLQTAEHRRFREQWIRELAANFDFGLTVIAGQNHLEWHEAEPAWADNLKQYFVGGLSESDACLFLANCKPPPRCRCDGPLSHSGLGRPPTGAEPRLWKSGRRSWR